MVSPGLSSVPANTDPIMTAEAPAARALVMSPEYLIPPSAMRGIFFFEAAAAHFMIADTWGTPTPAITRVVQIDPGPTPTFTQSAPALMIASAPSPVATFPAMSWTSRKFFRIARATAVTPREGPWGGAAQRAP